MLRFAILLCLCSLSLIVLIILMRVPQNSASLREKRDKIKPPQKEKGMVKIIEMAAKLFGKVSGGSCAMSHSKTSTKRFLNQSFHTPPNSHFGP